MEFNGMCFRSLGCIIKDIWRELRSLSVDKLVAKQIWQWFSIWNVIMANYLGRHRMPKLSAVLEFIYSPICLNSSLRARTRFSPLAGVLFEVVSLCNALFSQYCILLVEVGLLTGVLINMLLIKSQLQTVKHVLLRQLGLLMRSLSCFLRKYAFHCKLVFQTSEPEKQIAQRRRQRTP